MSFMFWIALELSIPKIRFNVMLSLTVKELNAFKFDGVAESDNTEVNRHPTTKYRYSKMSTSRPSSCFIRGSIAIGPSSIARLSEY